MRFSIVFAIQIVCLLTGTIAVAAAAGADLSDFAQTPPGYPTQHVSDTFATTPFAATYAERRQTYIDYVVRNPGNGPFSEAIRLSQGKLPNEQCMRSAFQNIDTRVDCSDFRMNGILRLMYQFGDSPLLSDAFKAKAKNSILNYKYWPDEPGIDSMCYWSENHYIMFSAAGYLAGQLYPDEVFVNSGRTGREQAERFRPRILKWMDLRFKTGFSEWLSNVYYNEDFPPLLNLADFAGDPELSSRAAMIIDLLLTDMALNSFHGLFGSTHGRSYEGHKKWASHESTGAVSKLVFGTSEFGVGNMSASFFTVSPKYRPPRVLFEMANDMQRPECLNRQRVAFFVEDAPKYGLDYNRLEDGMLFLAMEAYTHPRVFPLTLRMFDEYRWWQNDFFEPFAKQRTLIEKASRFHVMPIILWKYRHDVQRNLRGEANIYTYRTPDYMLSSAQDYRPGFGGDQQHVWQASLGPNAVCFTTHPAQKEAKSPSYWTGAGSLPRVGQVENVAVILHRISTKPGLYVTHELEFTHAWLPRDQFDEFVERDAWKFARKGDGYLALWSKQPAHWQTEPGEDQNRELIAPGKRNIWICELGRRADYGSFEEFIARIMNAHLWSDGLDVAYRSPSQGLLEFGWKQSLRHDGKRVALDGYPRYDNPYGHADFPAKKISFTCNGETLRLDWETPERAASAFMKAE